MNPTNFNCPSDISMFVQTDYRPNKALYVNVHNNNDFRMFLQRNADAIRAKNLQNYTRAMNCSCESNPVKPPFDSSYLDSIESGSWFPWL